MISFIVAALILLLIWLPPILYKRTGRFKPLFHDILEWHEPDDGLKWTDGYHTYAHCKHCGERIIKK